MYIIYRVFSFGLGFCYYYFFKVPTAKINQEDQATRGKCLLTFGRLEKSTKVYGDN